MSYMLNYLLQETAELKQQNNWLKSQLQEQNAAVELLRQERDRLHQDCLKHQTQVDDLTNRLLQTQEALQQCQEQLALEQKEKHLLQAAEAELSAVLDNCPIVIYVKDLEGRLTRVNREFEQLLNLKREEILGQSSYELFPPEMADTHAKNDQMIATSKKAVVAEEEALQGDQVHTYLSVKFPIFDPDGNVRSVGGISTDISDRKRIEQALKYSEERYRTLITATAHIIWDTSAEGEVVKPQPGWSAFTGQTFEELAGWGWLNAVHPEDQPETARNWSAAVANKTIYQVEHRVRRYDGEYRHMSVWGVPIVQEGQIQEWIGIHTDISDGKQANEALQRSEAQLREKAEQLEQTLIELQRTQTQLVQNEKMSSLGQLVAGVAHEINNPVNFIYGNLSHAHDYIQDLLDLIELYRQHYPNPAAEVQRRIDTIEVDFLTQDLPKLLNSMKVGADRIQKIVASLRNFSRMDEAEVKAVDIHEGIDSTLMILQNRIKERPDHTGIEIVKDYSRLPLVECYAGQLNQVFMNILSNAIDALDETYQGQTRSLPEGSTASPIAAQITIQTRLTDDNQRVQICIIDNASGMNEEVQRRIFEPFYTTKPVGKGTGMGLSISYQVVVEKHGGNLHCLSTPGEGTTFVIEIPVK
ncbi:MAG: PAS domain S-box protein [Oscillatoriales cyanobacterium C42_A2020_001]|nr:PAS domain S-box protein [Leptolyngbyaceae cyanobacterium C42_A2020_001]